ncbi:MAG: MerR family transcriptional regulator [Chloroflexus sp.]|jgi:DNA-binding transcriptional MerR regulator|uniref:MerR family transcriptional regulator n=1 Tax=Chloroflexus sp. TaxID=1904827 RepID=UPI0021DBA625|nr:MerR family transcriptional regulator [Chloroflexus sp.]GIV89809.1 MAG: MerR family transcriptional regulator [Chloroflexus sp.]
MHIRDLARQTGVSPKTIRYYEQIGLLPPPQRAENNYRCYTQADVERLRFIVGARSLDLSLREIAAILAISDHGEAPCTEMIDTLDHHIATIDRRIADLQALRSLLIGLRQQGDQNATLWEDCVCALVRDRVSIAERNAGSDRA